MRSLRSPFFCRSRAIAALMTVAAVMLLALVWRPMNLLLDRIILPSGAMPKLDGPYLPGHMSDSVSVHGRPLSVDIWYPRDRPPRGEAMQAPGASSRVAGDVPAASAILEHFGLVENAPPAAAPAKFPMLIFVPGWNGGRRSNTVLNATLAAAGYVVVAIDDVGGEASPTGDAAHNFDFSTDAGFANSWQVAERRLAMMTERVSGVIGGVLDRSGGGADWPFAGRLDPEALGVLGFSFGGSVAAAAPRTDRRIRAAANLDGWLMGAACAQGIAAPYLSFSSEFPGLEGATRSWSTGRRLMAKATVIDRRCQRELSRAPDTFALILKGTQHSDFTDGLFAPALRNFVRPPWGLWREGQLKVHEITVSMLLSFFDTHLRHRGIPSLLSERPGPHREVVWIGPE